MKKQVLAANIGDSRCVISRAGLAIDMSFDHKPEDDIELKRIIKAGGFLTGNMPRLAVRRFLDHIIKFIFR